MLVKFVTVVGNGVLTIKTTAVTLAGMQVSVTHVKNEILYMGGLDERISGATINRVGDAIGSYYAYKAIGIYRTEADLNRTNSKGEKI